MICKVLNPTFKKQLENQSVDFRQIDRKEGKTTLFPSLSAISRAGNPAP